MTRSSHNKQTECLVKIWGMVVQALNTELNAIALSPDCSQLGAGVGSFPGTGVYLINVNRKITQSLAHSVFSFISMMWHFFMLLILSISFFT